MDFHLKQWRNQQEHESEEQHSTKMPKLFLPESHHHHQQHQPALPFFVPEPNSKVSTLSDSTMLATTNNRFPRGMGSHFSLSQWQELELQALIFRYMLAGATVPTELLQPIKKSLLHSPPFFLHHLQPPPPSPPAAFLQSGYWGRAAMDPEPGRCRRTDGKKWRCSRDVVAGQKYCERHMHRGRNRSRKPVELPTPTSAGGGGGGSFCALSSISSPPPLATPSLKSPFHHLLHSNERCSSGTSNVDKRLLFESEDDVGGDVKSRSGGHMLRHFFDDWPRSLQETDNTENNANATGRRRMNSSTCLSISMPGNNHNHTITTTTTSSDVSLKLSTGYGEEEEEEEASCPRNENVDQQVQLNWIGGWTSTNQVASMGGPLAEALRSSTSTSSPTSVLHQLPPRSSASETSYIST